MDNTSFDDEAAQVPELGGVLAGSPKHYLAELGAVQVATLIVG